MDKPDADAGRTAAVVIWHKRAALAMLGILVLALVASTTTDIGLTRSVVLVLGASGVITAAAVLAARRAATSGEISLLAWPALAICTMAAFGSVNHEAASLMLGVFVLAFLFIGLTQPLRRWWWLIAPAAAAMWLIVDLRPGQSMIRVTLAVVVWSLVACWPAFLLEQVRAQRHAIALAAATDPLTGVQNRTHLEEHLERVGPESALVLIDLDRFKHYNDEHGHLNGDKLLREFADTLVAQTRSADAVYRFGGEEFLVVLHGTPLKAAADFADRLAVEWSAHPSGTTFSAGIATADASGLVRADASLYDAKRSGRGRTIVNTTVSGRIGSGRP